MHHHCGTRRCHRAALPLQLPMQSVHVCVQHHFRYPRVRWGVPLHAQSMLGSNHRRNHGIEQSFVGRPIIGLTRPRRFIVCICMFLSPRHPLARINHPCVSPSEWFFETLAKETWNCKCQSRIDWHVPNREKGLFPNAKKPLKCGGHSNKIIHIDTEFHIVCHT